MYVASDAPDPAGACMPCLCLEVCAALLSCWRSLSSGPGYLLHFSPTGTHSPVGPSPLGYLQYLFQEL